MECRIVNGVYAVYKKGSTQTEFPVPGTPEDFFSDLHHILKILALGPVKTFCYQRLMLLEQKFNLHVMMNADREYLAQKSAPHRDFYNVRKVGTPQGCLHPGLCIVVVAVFVSICALRRIVSGSSAFCASHTKRPPKLEESLNGMAASRLFSECSC